MTLPEPYYRDESTTLYVGDCRDIVSSLEGITAVVTDPPYGLEFMGKEWDKLGAGRADIASGTSKGGSSRFANSPPLPSFGKAGAQNRLCKNCGGSERGKDRKGFKKCRCDAPDFPVRDYAAPGRAIYQWHHAWAETLLSCCLPGAPLLAFGGTRTHHRLMCAIEDAGWEIRDCLNWLYGSGFPKSLNIAKQMTAKEVVGNCHSSSMRKARLKEEYEPTGQSDWKKGAQFETPKDYASLNSETELTEAAKQWDGWGTALKPAWEPIVLAMKPLDGTFADNAQKHGIAGLNIDGCRIGDFQNTTPPGTDRYNQANFEKGYRPNAYQNGNGRDGEASAEKRYTDKGSTNIAAKPGPRGGSPAGRWPANVITDGSEEVLAGFPETTSGAMKQDTEAYEGESATGFLRGRSGPGNQHGDSGSAARFFYCAKASGTDRGNLPSEELPLFGESVPEFRNTHPTVKPLALMEYLVKLVTMPERNLILDLFAGSGTTLVACKRLGIPCIGIELNEEYAAIAATRLRQQVLAF